MRRTSTSRAHSGGFSLIEFAVALVIVGALGLLVWQFLPRLKSLPAMARLTGTTLEQAETALNGFILANGRLPCPDATAANTGNEDCAAGASMGWLPVRTLGLSLSERVRYGVYRAPSVTPALDMDLAVLPDRYAPLLPASLNAVEPVYLNGLDFCVGLRNLTGTTGAAALTTGSQQIAIAYGLAVAGAGDADRVADAAGNTSVFDGLNAAAGRFELAGRARNASYDDDTRTVGSAELFTRLGCATRLSGTNAAARAAYAAYDIDQVAEMHRRFRSFQIEVRTSNQTMAVTSTILAAADLANAIASSANAIALVVETGGATTAPLIAAGITITVAIAAVTAAALGVASADASLVTANNQYAAALNFKSLTAGDLAIAAARIGALDAKGLLP